MITLMQFLMLVLLTVTPGKASQYAPGVMNRVIRNRQAHLTSYDLPQNAPVVDGYIAVLDCEDIGQIWQLRPTGQTTWERFWVVDCASVSDARESDGLSGAQWMIKHDITVEVDYRTAVRWNTVGRMMPIEVLSLEYGIDTQGSFE